MSDKNAKETEEKPAGKKGGKLPVIAVAALALAGGGFFMMKGKGDKKEVKKIELGPPITLKEILVNLKGSEDAYIKTEIALQATKEFKAEEVEKNAALINDAIILRLKTKSRDQLNSIEGLKELKRELADDINSVLPKEEKKDKEGADAEAKGSKEEKESGSSDEAKKDGKEPSKDDEKAKESTHKKGSPYDSDKGPVMKVLFNSFATNP